MIIFLSFSQSEFHKKQFSKTARGNFHIRLWSTDSVSFMRFGDTRCKRGRDPMGMPTFSLKLSFKEQDSCCF